MATTTVSSVSNFPSTKNLQEGMESAKNSEGAAEYLAKQVEKKAESSGLLRKSPELAKNVIAALQRFVEHIRFKLAIKAQPWKGEPVETSDIKNMHSNLADEAIKELNGRVVNLKVDYAVSNKGHYVRGYSSKEDGDQKGTPLNSESGALDKLFNAWLATKDYIMKGGYLYNANEINQGESNRMSPEIIKKLIAEGGFPEYLAEKGINASTKERNYPGKQNEEEIKQEVKSAAEKATARAVEKNEAPDIEPEAPQAGTGAH